jgi:GTP-binding protein HflX
VLAEIGAGQIPQILVYNKIDRLGMQPRIDRNANAQASAVWISAQKHLGLDLLAEAVAERLTRFARKARIRIQASAGAVRSRLYAAKAVREEHSAEDGSMDLAVELPDVELLTLARTPGVQILEVVGADMPCAPGTSYLQSTPVSGPKHAS